MLALRRGELGADVSGMAGVPRLAAPAGAAILPLDVRDPAVARALGDLVGNGPSGLFELDLEYRCTFVNAGYEQLTGRDVNAALGDGWLSAFHPDDIATLRTTSVCELRVVDDDGNVRRWLSVRTTPLRHAAGAATGLLGTLEDVTDRKRLEERLEFDATHDRLTGLGSRGLLAAELTAALAGTRRGGPGVTLLFIDLDGFKRVNDMLGHAAGDDLLVQVAQRLTGAVRAGDFCVRLGGDEFVVCSIGVGEPEQSVHLAERLLATLSEPYDVHGHEVLVGASIGIASVQGEDPVSVDQLLSNADIASYRAKRLGRGRVEVFDDDLRRRLSSARRVARSVGRLLDQPRVPILCTPIVHLATRNLVGFDCTIDWDAADVTEAPDAVARIVEEAGMSRALDVALVRTVLAQLGEWEQTPPGAIVPGLSVSLTRSGALSPLVPEIVRDMLSRSRVTPSLCWLGVPESAVAADLEAASLVAASLDELGIGVALRDFGSAVSSLEQLRRLPTPTMTVAGPLVAAVHEAPTPDDASTALLGAIVQYAGALGRIVVAFGVQDEAHAQRLQHMGCDFGAGPAFGPVLPPAHVGELLT